MQEPFAPAYVCCSGLWAPFQAAPCSSCIQEASAVHTMERHIRMWPTLDLSEQALKPNLVKLQVQGCAVCLGLVAECGIQDWAQSAYRNVFKTCVYIYTHILNNMSRYNMYIWSAIICDVQGVCFQCVVYCSLSWLTYCGEMLTHSGDCR